MDFYVGLNILVVIINIINNAERNNQSENKARNSFDIGKLVFPSGAHDCN